MDVNKSFMRLQEQRPPNPLQTNLGVPPPLPPRANKMNITASQLCPATSEKSDNAVDCRTYLSLNDTTTTPENISGIPILKHKLTWLIPWLKTSQGVVQVNY